MKKLSFLLLLLAGCATRNTCPTEPATHYTLPPMPPARHLPVQVVMSPKLAEMTKSWTHVPSKKAVERAGPTVVTPRWNFVMMPTNTLGNWQIEATTDLNSGVWYPVAVVYGATNVVLTSDTLAKRSMLFYRVKQVK